MDHKLGELVTNSLRLPDSMDVDKNKLLQIFNKTTTSYKYLFFMALLKIVKRDGFTTRIISFDDLARNMLAIAWYPNKLFKLSFGLVDQVSLELDKIHADSITSLDLSSYISYNKNISKVLSSVAISPQLMRYVPFRLIQPFFSGSLKGVLDAKVNEHIIHLAKTQFEKVKPFYYIEYESRTIVLHPAWLSYFYDNIELIESFSKWEWLSYMQKRNPSVVNLQTKLFPQIHKEGMGIQTRFWKSVIQAKPIQCIYSNEKITVENFSLDHFIPWSFVAHNQLWNLIPTPRYVNSSKSNNLPSLDTYFEAYARLQHIGLSTYHDLAGRHVWNKTIEPYQLDLKIKKDEILNIDFLKKQLRLTIEPLISIASNMGFSKDWIYEIF